MKQRPRLVWIAGLALGAALLGPSVSSVAAEPSPETKAIYAKNCKKCHGWDGTADTGEGRKQKMKSFTTPQFQKEVTDDDIVKAIMEGWVDPKDPKHKMKAYKDVITEAQARELVKVVRAYAKPPGPFPGEK